ncbi:putative uncharacterized protein [Clostridium sp. CAG:411]|nr:hypothetical protein [Lachnospiraceae bacterium]CDE46915.1 putative uncharacterized protein [Clostridium sp. CAG:411]
MSKTKIVVLQRKELIYTGILIGLGFLFILLFVFMFHGKEEKKGKDTAQYTPGVYTTELSLNDTLLNVQVVVDESHVNSVSFENIDESVSAMYPLLEPTLTDIEKQLCNNVAIENISTTEDNKYTQTLLLDAVKKALSKAEK